MAGGRVAYLESLTDATFITDPRFSDPFADTVADDVIVANAVTDPQ